MKSTIFKNFNEVIENKDILKILDDIKTGTYRNAITYLRKSLAEDKKEAAERNPFRHSRHQQPSKEAGKWNSSPTTTL